jgi:hypothetical protein
VTRRVALLAILLAAPLAAQEAECVWVEQADGTIVCELVGEPVVEEPAPPEPAALPPEPEDPRLAAAAWYVVRRSGDDLPEGEIGRDFGLGVGLLRWRRLSWVAVVGAQSLGTGLAWVAHRGGEGRPVIAVAVGVVAPYDEGGVYSDQLRPAVGATVALGRGE